MEQLPGKRSKGGRPKKAVRRDQLMGVKCTLIERRAIEGKARSAGLTVSEYLRELGLTTKISGAKRAIPKEALLFFGTTNHVAANLNQIAHKRNKGEVLNALERATLMNDADTYREFIQEVKKKYFP